MKYEPETPEQFRRRIVAEMKQKFPEPIPCAACGTALVVDTRDGMLCNCCVSYVHRVCGGWVQQEESSDAQYYNPPYVRIVARFTCLGCTELG